ncbi:MAG: hypothetical protein WDW38_001818 [Sanguina aurantia]
MATAAAVASAAASTPAAAAAAGGGPVGDWKKLYSETQKLKARILYVDPANKKVGLSLLPHLLSRSLPSPIPQLGAVYEGAVVRRVDTGLGLLLEFPLGLSPCGGYVHVSNVADERTDKPEASFKAGQRVAAKVIGFRLVDGLAALSMKQSVVSQKVTSFKDLAVGMSVDGVISSVETYGLLVSLSGSVRGVVPTAHMSDLGMASAKKKFKVGMPVSARVLQLVVDEKRLLLTMKATLCSSKLPIIASPEQAEPGVKAHGVITGVTDYGLFVTFFGGMEGLAHRNELGLTPGQKPSELHHVGQVVKCQVLSRDPATNRIKLSLAVKKSATSHDWHGVPHSPCSCPLVVLERLLGQRVLRVSRKASLVAAAATLPRTFPDIKEAALMCGYVANVTADAVFVRFLGQLTGRAGLAQMADTFVSDPSRHFVEGQSVRAQVVQVDEKTQRFGVTLRPTLTGSSDAAYLHGLLRDLELAEELRHDADVAAADESPEEAAAAPSVIPWASKFAVGRVVSAVVSEVKEYGVLCDMDDHEDVVGHLELSHTAGTANLVPGTKISAAVLDVGKDSGIVELSLKAELVSGAGKDKAAAKAAISKLKVGQSIEGVVQLQRDAYLVLSLTAAGNTLAFASTSDYNLRSVEDVRRKFTVGQKVVATVQVLPSTSTGGRLLAHVPLLRTSGDAPSAATASATPRKAAAGAKAGGGGAPATPGEGGATATDADGAKKDGDKAPRAKLPPGSVVSVTVTGVQPHQLDVAMGSKFKGRIHVTEILDLTSASSLPATSPLHGYKVQQTLDAVVLGRSQGAENKRHGELELSCRPALLAKQRVAARICAAGTQVAAAGRHRRMCLLVFTLCPVTSHSHAQHELQPSSPALRHAHPPALRHAHPPALTHAHPPALAHAHPPARRHAHPPALSHAHPPALAHAHHLR